jgi:CheY-like chemotaxis protein
MNWDITAEQEAEDALTMAKESAEAAEKSKSEFLAIMSHELRTPMNGVLGFAELLSRTELQPKQESFVEAITLSGDALVRIIDDILDFSRIEAGQMPIENAPFSLVAVIHEVCELLSARNKRQNVELKSEISARTPARVIGDAWRLRQVLINLAGNALKFTSEGEVWIRVDSEGKNGATKGMDIQFSVTDTGQGMSSDALERIFKPFTQADASIARRYGGSGLGLAISEKLVNLMGGTLRGTSRLGEGSEFDFTLSLQPALSEIEDEPIPRKVFARDFAVEHPLSILIADDDPLNRKLAQLFLQDLGYQPATATNGLEAIELFLAQKPDLVLIDEQMPGLSGLEVATRIREIEASNSMPNENRCYISAVTASALPSTQKQCFSVGMDDYMTKPLATETLAGVLSKASDRRKSAGTV